MWSPRFRRLAKIVKYIRIPALMVSVYALGRQQGIIECSRNPRLVEDELLQSILADVGTSTILMLRKKQCDVELLNHDCGELTCYALAPIF